MYSTLLDEYTRRRLFLATRFRSYTFRVFSEIATANRFTDDRYLKRRNENRDAVWCSSRTDST